MAANKDQEKLDQLYALYEQPMYRIAYAILHTQNRRKMLYPMRFSES